MSYPAHMKQGNNYSGYNFSNAGNITELNPAQSVSDNDVMLVHNGTNPLKVLASKLKEYIVGILSDLTTTNKSSVVAAVNEVNAAVAKCECLIVQKNSISSLPQTISNDAIETDMVCLKAYLSNSAAQTGEWTVNTDTAGQLTLSGTISGTTNVTLYMLKSGDTITG